MDTGDKIKKQASKWEKDATRATSNAKSKIDKQAKKIKSEINQATAKGEKLQSQGKDILGTLKK